MKKRIYHTQINVMIEPQAYQRLRMNATLNKSTMSKIIREGIEMILDRMDKENNAIMEEKNDANTTR